MCVLLLDNTPVRFAWTGDEVYANEASKARKRRTKRSRPQQPATAKMQKPKDVAMHQTIMKFEGVDHYREMMFFEEDETAPANCSSHIKLKNNDDKCHFRSRGHRGHDTYKNYRTGRKINKTSLVRIMRQPPIPV